VPNLAALGPIVPALGLFCLVFAACAVSDDDVVPAEAAKSSLPVSLSAPTLRPDDYLVPWACADGVLEMASPGCPDAHPITAQEPLRMRPHDLPGRNSDELAYQIGGGWVISPGRFASIWSYRPWGRWTLPDDGGEVYAAEGDTARAVMTQDGGKPYLQVFQGPECGGDGWLLFATDAQPDRWTERVARLSGGRVGEPCHPLGQALTRYRISDIDLEFTHDGVRERYKVRTVITQHFDHETIAKSQAMEEFYFGYHVGRYRWSSYTRSAPMGADLDLRCPARPYTGEGGFTLNDCRDLTNLRSGDGAMTGAGYGWP
jgi:hypothetical protein